MEGETKKYGSLEGQLLAKLREDLAATPESIKDAEALIKSCSSEALMKLGMVPPPVPVLPDNLEKMPIRQRLKQVQKYLSSFEYNHCPGFHFNINKRRSFARIMDTARDMMRDMFPIKCLEAVFIGMYLSCGWIGIDRFPLSFKTRCQGQSYRHIVLAIHHRPTKRFGSLGISRRENLMYKDLAYKSLAELVTEFKSSYAEWNHTIVKIHVGLPAEHNAYSTSPACWRCCTLSTTDKPWDRVCAVLDDYAGKARQFQEKYRISGVAPQFAESTCGD